MKTDNSKRSLWFVIVFLLFSTCSIVVLVKAESTQRIIVAPEELTLILETTEYTIKNQEDMLLIDLRDREDYQSEHIANSINLPFKDEGISLVSYLEKHNYRSKSIYLMCYSGKRSAEAFNLLNELNFKYLNYIRFGFDEYVSDLDESILLKAGKCKCEDEE